MSLANRSTQLRCDPCPQWISSEKPPVALLLPRVHTTHTHAHVPARVPSSISGNCLHRGRAPKYCFSGCPCRAGRVPECGSSLVAVCCWLGEKPEPVLRLGLLAPALGPSSGRPRWATVRAGPRVSLPLRGLLCGGTPGRVGDRQSSRPVLLGSASRI